MAEDVERPGADPEHEAGPPHLPSPTIWPIGFAAGVALVLVGLVVSWPVVAVGAGLAVVFGFLWARDLTREVRRRPPAPEEPAPVHELVEPPAEDEETRVTRSAFLTGSTLGLGAVISGIVTVPVIGFAVAPAFVGQGYDDVDLGPLENYAEGKWFVATYFSEKDAQSDVSLRTAYVRYNGFKDQVPSFTILSNRCVHLGCPVQPGGLLQQPLELETESGRLVLTEAQGVSGFTCPCHGGAYDSEGNRTAGPPVRALDRYKFSVVNGRLILNDPYSVGSVAGTGADAVITAYQISDPSVHVDGPDAVLYPFNP